MAGQFTYYDMLGVIQGASVDEVQVSYEAKAAVLTPDMVAGAPSKVIAVVDQARAAINLAVRTLTDPVARERYDVEIGIVKPGSGLMRPFEPPSSLDPHPSRPWHVGVPDVRGLFAGPARSLIMGHDLRAEFIQLTKDPMPVEGLVVDQSPSAGSKAHYGHTITMQVWHPSQQVQQRA
jgi:curved DNA-binding protein CbpA